MTSSPEGGGPPRRVRRFTFGERALHWLLAVTFFAMLATGLALFVPALAPVVSRPQAKAWHIDAALALAVGTAAVFAASWSQLRQTVRDLDRLDRDDARWLLRAVRVGRRRPAPPQGRFNAGQKLNAAVVGGLMVVMFFTGALLLVGERDTRYRFDGTLIVHDWATAMLGVLVVGHLYMAVVHRSTRRALRGVVLGDVDRAWALAHHEKWVRAQDLAEAAAAEGGVRNAQNSSREDAGGP
jgi:formate dehydrogenase subunit gamma